ncbi:MAG: tRNA 2-thiouridine(34) synthase MnmA [Oscillospiraceae bacterium]|nr:tRNA 2-thiouridine(34) synthase MnmA [Oscillospiraceae bacterium]
MKERLAVAMSGGVDSSVAAYLLGRQGHELIGITLRLHHCAGPEEAEQAARVAGQLGFGHRTVDLTEAFRHRVMDEFAAAYEQGCTPNPCLSCNRHIKFGAMVDLARELGCVGVATGHYARISRDSAAGRYLLRTALHPEKDQSYVLYMLTQQQLAASRFPLGELSKEEIRSIAARQGLVNAHKADSQDICFIPDGDYPGFIRRHTGRDYPTGNFIDPEGRVLGRHEGIIAYTLGQRRGLGVSSANGRLYVTGIDPRANTVTLGGNDALFARTVEADGINFIPFDRLDRPMRLQAKARYRHPAQEAVVEQVEADRIRVTFDRPQRAMTPGQAVVLYDGDVVVGGGTIRTVAD